MPKYNSEPNVLVCYFIIPQPLRGKLLYMSIYILIWRLKFLVTRQMKIISYKIYHHLWNCDSLVPCRNCNWILARVCSLKKNAWIKSVQDFSNSPFVSCTVSYFLVMSCELHLNKCKMLHQYYSSIIYITGWQAILLYLYFDTPQFIYLIKLFWMQDFYFVMRYFFYINSLGICVLLPPLLIRDPNYNCSHYPIRAHYDTWFFSPTDWGH